MKPRRNQPPGLSVSMTLPGLESLHPAVIPTAEILQVALVLLHAVHETLVVVVDDGAGAHQGVEVALGELCTLPVQLTKHDAGDVEVRQSHVATHAIHVGRRIGVPGCDDVETDGDGGVLGERLVGAPLQWHELDEDGWGVERGLLLDELDLAVPEVEMPEQGLPLLVVDGHQLLLDGEVKLFQHGVFYLVRVER